jgi:serine protease Do
MIQMNGVDLKTFQFDYDMTFAVFFMNADKTIYGSRSDIKEAQREISMESLVEALKGALEHTRATKRPSA